MDGEILWGLRHVYLDNQTPIKPIPASLKEYPWVIRKIQALIR